MQKHCRDLTPASGRQATRLRRPRQRRPSCAATRVHRIPHPTFVTIAIRPFIRGGTAGITKGVSSKRRSEIFLPEGLDTIPADLPVGQITSVSWPDSEGYILPRSSICSLIRARTRCPACAFELRRSRRLEPAKSDDRNYRDYPVTGLAAGVPKSTGMTLAV